MKKQIENFMRNVVQILEVNVIQYLEANQTFHKFF